ncbi:MAG TPA: heme o synthase [Candidatus Dormibacteraeota bacterium]|nr:heme o synthase [Candidatus Dormibacteraeota bacterium]
MSAHVVGATPRLGDPAVAAIPAGSAAPTPPAPAAPLRAGRGQVVRDYVALTKPRVVSLLVVTSVAAMFVAQSGTPALDLLAAVIGGGWLAAGGANAINMWFDRDIDAEMYRTRQRPIPAGRVPARRALAFGIVLNVLAFVILTARANLLAASLTLSASLFYVFVYTMWLKRSTPQNIVIGGAAGAFPPLIGWAAVTGHLSLTALYMFMIVFFWTPPHFWALAIRLSGDYGRAQVPMMPEVRGGGETRRWILLYTLVLVAITLLPGLQGFGLFYLVASLALGAGFIAMAVLTLLEDGRRWARRTFTYSLAYLAAIFAAMVVDALIRG